MDSKDSNKLAFKAEVTKLKLGSSKVNTNVRFAGNQL